jgi:hypothetical protein
MEMRNVPLGGVKVEPLEKRYTLRVFSALKWAFADSRMNT